MKHQDGPSHLLTDMPHRVPEEARRPREQEETTGSPDCGFHRKDWTTRVSRVQMGWVR